MTTIARALATAAFLLAAGTPIYAQTPQHAATQFLPIKNEPAPKLFVDQPLPRPLITRGVAIIPYRAENFRILPIFGAGATDVSPRAGHLHVSIDDLPWRWADAGGTGAIVLTGLPPGEHKVLIEIATPEHQVLGGKVVKFTVPAIDSSHH
ncbi:DUF6130 family protein [Sinorhizobium medicae]|uniref:DUF4399 domain-containing protein n=1 Tax=Sinorhizobium medicae TaxID=110321 RepID=A0ABX4TJZ0_9HYPH|nr:DUF6130 family protein [Sinorhizobium medicae]PLU02579.1 hypothetical protein BMJ33_16700 [Sinorhizobium medicae]PLU14119.1 hypothetical protein BMJ30_24195 [Sinorhizobium medicae]PLU19144.1 hypothetical protein BMJ29_16460 [Sinorhizobium medicae]PLU33611.1 hypothetical protein BMJ27_16730 [Sinorhizobium medicae]PLU78719.1 hypothetical protein BMJ19_16105 [Sinorhizobium medicae]